MPPAGHDPAAAAKLQILATEHWSLLATRSLTYTESLGRVNVFLAILSGAVIALALAAIAVGFVLGQVAPWRLVRAPAVAPAEARADASLGAAEPLPPDESRPIG